MDKIMDKIMHFVQTCMAEVTVILEINGWTAYLQENGRQAFNATALFEFWCCQNCTPKIQHLGDYIWFVL